MPDLAIRQTTTKGGYRGDNINDVGADYREAGVRCQAAVYLFYFIIVISCFCIVFYKDFCKKPFLYRRFFVEFLAFLIIYLRNMLPHIVFYCGFLCFYSFSVHSVVLREKDDEE